MGPAEEHPQLHAVGGVGEYPDPVKRLHVFREAHPEWRIIKDRDYHVWRAWRLTAGGEDNLTRYELSDLLDALGAP